MRPLNLQEFAEQLRLQGNKFADDILMLVDLEEEVAQPYGELCANLDHYAPDDLKNKPEKQLAWLGERSNLLEEIGDQLKAHDRTGDVDDEIGELLETVKSIETVMREHGGWTEGDLQDALFNLIERAEKAPPASEYDL